MERVWQEPSVAEAAALLGACSPCCTVNSQPCLEHGQCTKSTNLANILNPDNTVDFQAVPGFLPWRQREGMWVALHAEAVYAMVVVSLSQLISSLPGGWKPAGTLRHGPMWPELGCMGQESYMETVSSSGVCQGDVGGYYYALLCLLLDITSSSLFLVI